MDEHDEHEPEVSQAEPPTERVRIIGAEPAGVLMGEGDEQAPADDGAGVGHGGDDREARYLGFVHEPLYNTGQPGGVAPAPVAAQAPLFEDQPTAGEPTLAPEAPELPHWTEPPTGQVPAVLARDDDLGGVGDAGPVWREHQHEWEHDAGFEPAMLADDDTPAGVLNETPVEERRPWEFDDLTTGRVERVAPVDEQEADWAQGLPDTSAPADAFDDDTTTIATGTPGPSWWDEEDVEAAEPAEPEPAMPASPTLSGSPSTISQPSTWLGAPSVPPGPPSVPAPIVAPPSAPETLPAADAAAGAGSASARAPGDAAGDAATPDLAPIQRRRAERRHTPPRAPSGGRRNVPVAVATGAGFFLIGIACFLAGTVATVVLVTVVVTLAAAECFAALRRAGLRPATLLGLVATVAVTVSAYTKGPAALPLVLVLVVVTSMVWYLVGAEHGSPVEGISATVLGFAWVGLLGSFAGLMLAPSVYPQRHGIAFLFGAVLATVGADVGALAVGSWLGRHQLAPHVSPNKTWEGLIGGAVVAVAVSVLVTGHMHPWTPSKAAILGIVVAVVAPIGDLCESLVKRDLGLKDMGSLLPGHGGVLDRVDALLFVLPATYYLVRVLNLG